MSSTSSEQVATQPEKSKGLSNMAVRGLTSLVVMPIAIFLALLGGWPFALLIGLIIALGTLEFHILAEGRQSQGSPLIGVPVALAVALAFYLKNDAIWQVTLVIGVLATFLLSTIRHPRDLRRSLWQVEMTLAGVFYVAFPLSFLISIRALNGGQHWLFAVFGITWGADTFAYLGGRAFGKTKLAPTLSPNKTVEGAVAGVVGGIIPTVLILAQAGFLTLTSLIMVCIGPFIAIVGDLFESALKRFFGVKDSHIAGLTVFPGHGGVLDRVDSLIWVSTLVYLFLVWTDIAG